MRDSRNRYLIIGASSDLGISLIEKLNRSQQSALFMAHYHSDDREIQRIKAKNGNIIRSIQADLSKEGDIDRLCDAAQNYLEFPTHIVHFAAAKYRYTRLKKFNATELIQDFWISVVSLAEVFQRFLPLMARSGDITKAVVMLSSVIYGVPPKNLMDYVIVKSALHGLVKSMASDYGDKGVRINAVAPSMINTKFLCEIDSKIPMLTAESSIEKRNASVDDVVPVIEFLLSEDSNYMNGEVIKVTNGNVN